MLSSLHFSDISVSDESLKATMTAPVSEAARLAKLLDYGVLDTPPEREFDEITTAAAQLFNMPISLVSLIDRDRQWFKARYGLGVTETPRSQAFCAHAIEGDDLFVVSDATRDSRFADNPLVTGDPNIRFYAGAPLITPDNHKLGTLCVIDRTPRDPLNENQRTVLTMLARLVVRELENRRLARRAEHQALSAARITEAVVALALAPDWAHAMKIMTDYARSLCVADAARVVSENEYAQSQRDGAALADIPWNALDAVLRTKAPLKATTAGELPGEIVLPKGGAWVGFNLGGATERSATLHVWRRVISSYTEMELAMLFDLAREGAAVLQRVGT
jgi:GAF domain-containing protein